MITHVSVILLLRCEAMNEDDPQTVNNVMSLFLSLFSLHGSCDLFELYV